MTLNVIEGGFKADEDDSFYETLTKAADDMGERVRSTYEDRAHFVILVETNDGLEIAGNGKLEESYMVINVAKDIIKDAYISNKRG